MILALDSTGNITQFLTLLLIFAFVLAVTYYTTKFVANYQKGKMSRANMSVIEGLRISPDKYLELVKIGERYYVISVCKNSISLICEVPKEELVFSEDGEGEKPVLNFAAIMENLKNHKK